MPPKRDDFRLPLPPLDDLTPQKRPMLAPAWVALLAAWLGVLMLIASIVFVFLPGTKDPRAELTHRREYSIADKFLPVPIYGIAVAMFIGIVVLWQMRKEPRPLPDALIAQRVQAWAGILLAFIGAVIIYVHVAMHGPR
jgi:hypothetical protein